MGARETRLPETGQAASWSSSAPLAKRVGVIAGHDVTRCQKISSTPFLRAATQVQNYSVCQGRSCTVLEVTVCTA